MQCFVLGCNKSRAEGLNVDRTILNCFLEVKINLIQSDNHCINVFSWKKSNGIQYYVLRNTEDWFSLVQILPQNCSATLFCSFPGWRNIWKVRAFWDRLLPEISSFLHSHLGTSLKMYVRNMARSLSSLQWTWVRTPALGPFLRVTGL